MCANFVFSVTRTNDLGQIGRIPQSVNRVLVRMGAGHDLFVASYFLFLYQRQIIQIITGKLGIIRATPDWLNGI